MIQSRTLLMRTSLLHLLWYIFIYAIFITPSFLNLVTIMCNFNVSLLNRKCDKSSIENTSIVVVRKHCPYCIDGNSLFLLKLSEVLPVVIVVMVTQSATGHCGFCFNGPLLNSCLNILVGAQNIPLQLQPWYNEWRKWASTYCRWRSMRLCRWGARGSEPGSWPVRRCPRSATGPGWREAPPLWHCGVLCTNTKTDGLWGICGVMAVLTVKLH